MDREVIGPAGFTRSGKVHPVHFVQQVHFVHDRSAESSVPVAYWDEGGQSTLLAGYAGGRHEAALRTMLAGAGR